MKKKYRVLFILSLVAAVLTAIPAEASKPCFLGYYAHCSFTPISTAICLLIACVTVYIGEKRSE